MTLTILGLGARNLVANPCCIVLRGSILSTRREGSKAATRKDVGADDLPLFMGCIKHGDGHDCARSPTDNFGEARSLCRPLPSPETKLFKVTIHMLAPSQGLGDKRQAARKSLGGLRLRRRCHPSASLGARLSGLEYVRATIVDAILPPMFDNACCETSIKPQAVFRHESGRRSLCTNCLCVILVS